VRRARPVLGAARDTDPLAGAELDGSVAIEVHEQPPVEDEEDLVLLSVRVPGIHAVDHAEPHDGVIDAGQRLVVPGSFVRGH
jgi:hypothetical protein